MFKMTQSQCAVNVKVVNRHDQFSINMKGFQQGGDNTLKTGAEAPDEKGLQQL